jgi:hypothetical protein
MYPVSHTDIDRLAERILRRRRELADAQGNLLCAKAHLREAEMNALLAGVEGSNERQRQAHLDLRTFLERSAVNKATVEELHAQAALDMALDERRALETHLSLLAQENRPAGEIPAGVALQMRGLINVLRALDAACEHPDPALRIDRRIVPGGSFLASVCEDALEALNAGEGGNGYGTR